MSWYGVAIYPEDEAGRIAPWEELVDSLAEAAAYLQGRRDPALVAVEYDKDGEATGLIMKWELPEKP